MMNKKVVMNRRVMMNKSGLRDLAWAAVGVVALIGATLFTLHYYRIGDVASKSASREKRLELVAKMSSALASSSEAEKSAVMAVTDEESQMFANQARAASADVGRTRDILLELLEKDRARKEEGILTRFSQTFADLQKIDRDVLDLAVRNTNLKAYAMDFGPAADALAAMDGALTRIERRGAASTDPDSKKVVLLAAEAQSGAWRIQALLPPHISEENDAKLDALERRMASEDGNVRAALKGLASRIGSGNPDLATADSSYTRFTGLKKQILDLSRQNTNVRSLIISLNQKREALEACRTALADLEQAIQAESRAVRTPMSPR